MESLKPKKSSRDPVLWRVLDFGCGETKGLKRLLEHDPTFLVTSYDPFFYPDESWSEGTYDIIFASEVFEHLNFPQLTLKRLLGVLNKGSGLGVATSPPPESVEEFKHWPYRKDPSHVFFYSPKTWHYFCQQFNVKHFASPKKNQFIFIRT